MLDVIQYCIVISLYYWFSNVICASQHYTFFTKFIYNLFYVVDTQMHTPLQVFICWQMILTLIVFYYYLVLC